MVMPCRFADSSESHGLSPRARSESQRSSQQWRCAHLWDSHRSAQVPLPSGAPHTKQQRPITISQNGLVATSTEGHKNRWLPISTIASFIVSPIPRQLVLFGHEIHGRLCLVREDPFPQQEVFNHSGFRFPSPGGFRFQGLNSLIAQPECLGIFRSHGFGFKRRDQFMYCLVFVNCHFLFAGYASMQYRVSIT